MTRVINFPLRQRLHSKCPYLSGGLVESEVMSQLFLANSTGGVNLVTQDEEGDLGKFFNREQGVQLSL